LLAQYSDALLSVTGQFASKLHC